VIRARLFLNGPTADDPDMEIAVFATVLMGSCGLALLMSRCTLGLVLGFMSASRTRQDGRP
jgi:hypothetical protein